MGIDLSDNGADLTSGPLRIEDRGVRADGLIWSPRIGIRVGTERQWRCHWAGHPSVSGPKAGGRRGVAAAVTACA
jgi:3-methyladenine DNA glycosylase Mpg